MVLLSPGASPPQVTKAAVVVAGSKKMLLPRSCLLEGQFLAGDAVAALASLVAHAHSRVGEAATLGQQR